MATIKLKFRPSTVQGKAGTLCYQLCHRQENRQITTDMRIFPEWWNETKRELVTVPGNERVLTAYRKRAEKEMRDIREIIRELDCSGETYTLSEILNRYRSLPSESGFLYYMKKEMETLWENGQYGTSRNYRRALNSFSTFLDGNDIPFSSLDSALACRYEAWLWQQRVARNSSSFYMRILRAVYNKAVKQGIAVQTFPFREVYTGVARTSKRAVDEETILKLQRIDLSDSPALALSRDMFVFSYCARGMAFVDMAYLKKENVDSVRITYCRHKTGQYLTLHIEPCMAPPLEEPSPAPQTTAPAPKQEAAPAQPRPAAGSLAPYPEWAQITQKLQEVDPMLYSYLRKSKAYFDGTRVLIDGGKTFRDFIRANKDSQRLIKKLILQVSGKAIPIGPYEPRTAGKTVSNAEQSLHALEKLGLDVSIEDTARKQK